MSYRQKFIDRDISGFTQPNISEMGAMVIKAPKGKNTPVLCRSEKDILREYGTPSALYPELFEAIAFTRVAPCYIVAPFHNDALYGGIDVAISGLTAFGTGRDLATFDFTSYPTLSHVFFTTSPYTDDLVGKITYISGKKFSLTLYKRGTRGNEELQTSIYSLDREKDNFGNSIYIMDVFDDNYYVVPKVNDSFTGTAYNISGVVVNFSGGTRGSAIDSADILAGWNNFQYANKYPAKIFMDTRGDSAVTVNTIIQTYQPYAQGMSVVPMGNSASEAVTFRQGLGIDSDDIALYTNWSKIVDSYNNSFAWISNIGSVGKKWAKMYDVYDSESPAGIDENGHGGQLGDWEVKEMENDYVDADINSDFELLDDAQINPIIKDPAYGVIIKGDKTMQASLSDTSFIGTRRVYKYIVENVQKQVLILQEFRRNDSLHRLLASTRADSIVRPVYLDGGISNYKIVCDESNNTAAVLDQRKFILDIYVTATANAQEVILRLTRTAQGVDFETLAING